MPRILLIVEDVETCAATLEIAVSAMPFPVVTVASGEEAWRVLDRTEQVAAIITDLEMRGMDGYELIERVRAHPRHHAAPIVVITGSPDPDAPARIQKLGASAFFSKPYSPGQVRERLEQLLNEKA